MSYGEVQYAGYHTVFGNLRTMCSLTMVHHQNRKYPYLHSTDQFSGSFSDNEPFFRENQHEIGYHGWSRSSIHHLLSENPYLMLVVTSCLTGGKSLLGHLYSHIYLEFDWSNQSNHHLSRLTQNYYMFG